MYYIGIDLGTSAVKLLLMSADGKIKNVVSREYELYFPHPGWSEQNPDDWWNATCDGLKELISGIDKKEVKGIGVAGQMHGLVILDSDDKVIRKAILWNDGRTNKETDYLNNDIGKKKISVWTGNIAFPGFTAPKILWVKENEKENFAKINKIMLPKDYINYKLTGAFATDYSDASGMLLLDVENKKWSKEMLDLCNISEYMLPRLYESYEVIGELKPEVADEIGLDKSVKVVAGAGDNAAAAIGTGTVGNGACNISIGTSGTVFISSDKFIVDDACSLHSFAHSDGKYHLMGCMLSAAANYKWWLDNILESSDYQGESDIIKREKLGENHIYYLPYLMGERAPHNDPHARACFIGMTMDTKRADMTLAIYEGVAYGIRDSVEAARKMGIDVKRSMICGGGSKNPLWRDIFANVLNIELTTLVTEQGPGYGGAILAAVACGEYPDVKSATEKLVEIKDVVKPNKELVEKYEIAYQKFRRLYPALKEVFEANLVNV